MNRIFKTNRSGANATRLARRGNMHAFSSGPFLKALIKNSVNHFGLILLVLVAALFWTTGCGTWLMGGGSTASSYARPDPLAGWKVDLDHDPDQAIEKDYQDYIQKLPLEERKSVGGGIQFLEDGKGQHAIMIPIGLSGTWWRHVLIYDKNDKRIKSIKYSNGGYRS